MAWKHRKELFAHESFGKGQSSKVLSIHTLQVVLKLISLEQQSARQLGSTERSCASLQRQSLLPRAESQQCSGVLPDGPCVLERDRDTSVGVPVVDNCGVVAGTCRRDNAFSRVQRSPAASGEFERLLGHTPFNGASTR